ncbi:hypothetical protein D3C83_306540 [compost metagenome]
MEWEPAGGIVGEGDGVDQPVQGADVAGDVALQLVDLLLPADVAHVDPRITDETGDRFPPLL